MNTSQLTLALLLSVINNRLVEAIVDPLKKNLPTNYLKYMFLTIYVSFVTGGLLSYFSGVNLFVDYVQIPVQMGTILTAVIVGGGSQLLADVMNYLGKNA